MTGEIPGAMQPSDWHELEGEALLAEAKDSGNRQMERQGISRQIDASDEKLDEYLREEFTRLFPDEPFPEDGLELRGRVQMALGILPPEGMEE